jgi:hypothetical protein
MMNQIFKNFELGFPLRLLYSLKGYLQVAVEDDGISGLPQGVIFSVL